MVRADGARHGTDAGYQRHLRDGEKPCPACKAAHAARPVADSTKRRRSQHSRATSRALSELAKKHPYEFARLRMVELAAIEREEG